jgi:hypothetical protein
VSATLIGRDSRGSKGAFSVLCPALALLCFGSAFVVTKSFFASDLVSLASALAASLVSLTSAWQQSLLPFIVQLLGEYVIELTVAAEKKLSSICGTSYAKYLAENASYFPTVYRRAKSYLNAYYRRWYPELKEYQE